MPRSGLRTLYHTHIVLMSEQLPPSRRRVMKGAPTPIRIPSLSRHAPKVQIQRSAGKLSGTTAPQLPPIHTADSPITGDDNVSAISGFTLAGALAANAFSIGAEPVDPRQSRRITRKDSATLPHGYWKHGRRSLGDGEIISPDAGLAPPLPPLRSSSLTLDVTLQSTNARVDGDRSVADVEDRRLGRSQSIPETPPISYTPNTSRLLDEEPHTSHRVSPIAEAATPSLASPMTPEKPKDSSSSSSSNTPSSSSATQPQRTAASDVSHFLSPSSYARGSPYSDASGLDINDVLDDYIAASMLEVKAALEKTSSSPSPSVNSVSTGKRSPDRQLGGQPSAPRQRGNSGLLEIRTGRSRSNSRSKSRPSLASVNSLLLHPTTLLPIGERRGSTFSLSSSTVDEHEPLPGLASSLATSNSEHISQLPSFPESAGLLSASLTPEASSTSPAFPSTPDPLDDLVIEDAAGSDTMRRPSGSLNPITVVRDPRDPLSYDIAVGEGSSSTNTTPSTASGGKQTFPETPSAFSPVFSPQPPLPKSAASVALRTLSVNRATRARGTRLSQKLVPRSASARTRKKSVKSRPASKELPPRPFEPEASSSRSIRASRSETSRSARSNRSRSSSRHTLLQDVDSTAPGSALSPGSSGLTGPSSQRSSPSMRRAIPPPPVHVPPPPPPPTSSKLSPQPPIPETSSSADSSQNSASPPYTSVLPGASTATFGSISNRRMQARPPLPIGPRNRNTSNASALASGLMSGRDRNGSVTSLSRPSLGSFSQEPAPKFQSKPVNYKSYTMEAAKWTFSSEQLQSIVSTAIRQSAEPSAIRLLPPDLLHNEIPAELERLEVLQSELKVKYKLQVRKRNVLLMSVSASVEGQDAGAYTVRSKLDDLRDVTANLDQLAEDLYTARDQAAQLTQLMTVHSASALAMALRKLNTSFLKRSAEAQGLHQQIAALEAERDEAWTQAQQVAQDLDDLNESVNQDVGVSRSTSRRSSRVMASRKSSIRVSKAGLRSSRSYRGSLASQTASRASYISSAGAGTPSFGLEEIPPVPPIPFHRSSIGIVTTGLSSRNSGINSGFSSSSDSRALVQAQMDLYNMLGIDTQEMKEARPRRSSTTAAVSPLAVRPPAVVSSPRPASDVPGHRRAQSVDAMDAFHAFLSDEREAVLATLRMID
ncbi:hypothetical protein BV25DRAFT_1283554 [Artomyces pyxidatus]|uniref:Uncharacterized protein n=1 Tax=Artomyces pyxidatus TaxID=48021 RepID=A0ACB8SRD8_9AGAM|nr:hypothetical protein BV25DRAFT_1283554 [Artomyces pyxidatus]